MSDKEIKYKTMGIYEGSMEELLATIFLQLHEAHLKQNAECIRYAFRLDYDNGESVFAEGSSLETKK